MHELSSRLSVAVFDMAEHPFIWVIYVGLAACSGVAFLIGLHKRIYSICYLSLVALIGIAVIFNNRVDDAGHHIFRIAVLTEQVRSGHLDVFVTNYFSGERLPVFLYYSTIPYIAPVSLCLLGMPAAYAYKVSLISYLAFFAVGSSRLAKVYRGGRQDGYEELCAILLLSSNYVVSLWADRSALAELLSYSIVPWVVLVLTENPLKYAKAVTLIAIQMATHPIIFPQCACAELIAVWCLETTRVDKIILRYIVSGAIASLVAAPFWLPQLIFLHAVLGNSGIPVDFAGSFLTAGQLLNPFKTVTPGLSTLIAAGLAIASNRERFQKNKVISAVAVVISLIMQTVYARFITMHIPLLSISQFVWRLMFVSCFLVFIFLLLTSSVKIRWVRALCVVAVLNAFLICAWHTGKISLEVHRQDNHEIEAVYYRDRSDNSIPRSFGSLWGLGEYYPDYSNLKVDCEIAYGHQVVSAALSALEQGMAVSGSSTGTYVTVREAPVRFVRYTWNGATMSPRSSCDGNLAFGPFRASGVLSVDEHWIHRIVVVRSIAIGVLVFGCCLLFFYPRDPRECRETRAAR